MQEVLSQQEIDSLLNALDQGAVTPEETGADQQDVEAKNYDFRRPNKFSRDHLRTLEMLHQHFARVLSNFLSGYLRSSVNVEFASAAQIIYDEFIRSVPSPTVLTVFTPSPLTGSALMETNIHFVLPVIDLLFGGPGKGMDEERELTDIEVSVMKKLNSKILDNLATAWKEIYEIKPQVQAIETNPRLQQMYSANEVVALITFTVGINEENRGMINICLPFMVLEPVMSQLSMRQQFQAHKSREVSQREVELAKYCLRETRVNLEAVLGSTDITIEEFLHLSEGDTLLLNQKINQDLILQVEGSSKFGVQAGQYNNKKAVQVVSLKERENESV
ncbi:MAG: flagellar motor switch protein FliM [Clostridiales bacterium]|nr:flagellar motor switch protein FliM [Clostridiales bacterium]MCF8021695.1 flagellar motor switch protein FliM [Clostridiales bacterium]